MQKLLHEINNQFELEGDSGAAPIVSLELFFDGNEEESSIGCNLLNHPGIDVFYETLKRTKQLIEVQDIFVEIYEVEENGWPFSERIYILSTLHQDELMDRLRVLEPSDIEEGYQFGEPKAAPLLEAGMKVYSVWWD
ncbi:hypothetical protein [Paenibacillus bovis]|uniref:DUF4253 domain-containing protein n=1 Tax=Paenibacillus bovis TaxID=1616788 RepID=A0A172ZJM1_9BACL|nr:hypothetical protein [Paenibacillus bovis]ANF97845.1 hypothetical protein AR543_18715 [Paenibacillus bovis]